MKQLQYFGTDLYQAGHYFWLVNDHGLGRSDIKYSAMPFDPEDLPLEKKYPPRGTVNFYRIGGYTICRIEGSCKDNRGGSKSVFFIEGDIKFAELWDLIISKPIAVKMIEQMPFEVKDPRSPQWIAAKETDPCPTQ